MLDFLAMASQRCVEDSHRQPWLGSPVLCRMVTGWEKKKGRRKKVDSCIVGRKRETGRKGGRETQQGEVTGLKMLKKSKGGAIN